MVDRSCGPPWWLSVDRKSGPATSTLTRPSSFHLRLSSYADLNGASSYLMCMGFANANVSGKNNRKLQRTGNADFKQDKRAFFNRDIQRSEKPLHDQYNFADRTTSVWKRLFVALFFVMLVAVLIYALTHNTFLDAGRLVE